MLRSAGEMRMAHEHKAWAEVDEDGMYEPACEVRGCTLFHDTSVMGLSRRYPTWHEAAASAAAFITMIPGDGPDDDA